MSESQKPPSFPMQRCPFGPPAEYEQLREESPIAEVSLPDGRPAWLVTRYHDVRSILGDKRFSTSPKHEGYPFPTPSRAPLMRAERNLLRMDPPEHTKYRRMLTAEFTLQTIDAMRPYLVETINRLMDEMEDEGSSCDFVQAFALKLPSTVIAELLGVPRGDHKFFQERSTLKLDMAVPTEIQDKASRELREYFDGLLQDIIKNPEAHDNLSSRLYMSQVKTGNMTYDEALHTLELLLQAGHETTGNMISLGVLSLLLNPEVKNAIVSDPSQIKNTVEELLRIHSIVHLNGARVALEDVEVGGHLFRKGEGVLATISAANYDPAVFPNPHEINIHRPELRDHLAFSYGVHQCLGQALARAELQLAFQMLFERFPDLALAIPAEEIQYKQKAVVWGMHSLPLKWTSKRKPFFSVDMEKCVGGGRCVEAAPEVFAQNDTTGLIQVLQENPSQDLHVHIEQAARQCPASVIRIHKKQSKDT
jgi:cytochrome P450/ferredoxin